MYRTDTKIYRYISFNTVKKWNFLQKLLKLFLKG